MQYADKFRAEALEDVSLLVRMAAQESDFRESLKEVRQPDRTNEAMCYRMRNMLRVLN